MHDPRNYTTSILLPGADRALVLQRAYEERWREAFDAERGGRIEEAIELWMEAEVLKEELARCIN